MLMFDMGVCLEHFHPSNTLHLMSHSTHQTTFGISHDTYIQSCDILVHIRPHLVSIIFYSILYIIVLRYYYSILYLTRYIYSILYLLVGMLTLASS